MSRMADVNNSSFDDFRTQYIDPIANYAYESSAQAATFACEFPAQAAYELEYLCAGNDVIEDTALLAVVAGDTNFKEDGIPREDDHKGDGVPKDYEYKGDGGAADNEFILSLIRRKHMAEHQNTGRSSPVQNSDTEVKEKGSPPRMTLGDAMDQRVEQDNAEDIKAKEEEKIAKAKAEIAKAEFEHMKAIEDKKKAEKDKNKAEEEKIRAEEQKAKAEEQKVKAEEEHLKAIEEKLKEKEQLSNSCSVSITSQKKKHVNTQINDSAEGHYSDVPHNVFSSKMMQGYTIAETPCTICGLPLVSHPRSGNLECAVCPFLSKIVLDDPMSNDVVDDATTISSVTDDNNSSNKGSVTNQLYPSVIRQHKKVMAQLLKHHKKKSFNKLEAYELDRQVKEHIQNSIDFKHISNVAINDQPSIERHVQNQILKANTNYHDSKKDDALNTLPLQGSKIAAKEQGQKTINSSSTTVNSNCSHSAESQVTNPTQKANGNNHDSENKDAHFLSLPIGEARKNIQNTFGNNNISIISTTPVFDEPNNVEENVTDQIESESDNNQSAIKNNNVDKKELCDLPFLVTNYARLALSNTHDKPLSTGSNTVQVAQNIPAIANPTLSESPLSTVSVASQAVAQSNVTKAYPTLSKLPSPADSNITNVEERNAVKANPTLPELPLTAVNNNTHVQHSSATESKPTPCVFKHEVDEVQPSSSNNWTMVMEFCKGERCRKSLLLGRGVERKCPICGGTGDGMDGVYAIKSANDLTTDAYSRKEISFQSGQHQSPSSPPSKATCSILAQEVVSTMWKEVVSSMEEGKSKDNTGINEATTSTSRSSPANIKNDQQVNVDEGELIGDFLDVMERKVIQEAKDKLDVVRVENRDMIQGGFDKTIKRESTDNNINYNDASISRSTASSPPPTINTEICVKKTAMTQGVGNDKMEGESKDNSSIDNGAPTSSPIITYNKKKHPQQEYDKKLQKRAAILDEMKREIMGLMNDTDVAFSETQDGCGGDNKTTTAVNYEDAVKFAEESLSLCTKVERNSRVSMQVRLTAETGRVAKMSNEHKSSSFSEASIGSRC